MNQEQKPLQKVRITGLWKKTLRDGKEILWGYFGGAVVEIWPNTYKKEDSHPDFNLLIVEKPKEKREPKTEAEVPF